MREKIVEQCNGCKHVNVDGECDAYINPSIHWRFGRKCPLASHIKLTEEQPDKLTKSRVGQQKQKKKTRGK